MTKHYKLVRTWCFFLKICSGLLIVGALFSFAGFAGAEKDFEGLTFLLTGVAMFFASVIMSFWAQVGLAIADSADYAREAVSLHSDDIRVFSRSVDRLSQALEEQRIASGVRLSKAEVSDLIAALEDEDQNTAAIAAQELGQLGTKAEHAIPYLIKALGDSRGEISWRATGSLSLIGEAAVDPLIMSLQNPNAQVRGCAAYALGAIGPDAKAAVLTLIEIQKTDPSAEVQDSAAEALKKIQRKEP